MNRMRVLPVLVPILILAGAGIAQAHEEINPSSFPVSKPVFLSLSAANEKQVKLTKLTLNGPADLHFGEATRSSAGWTATRTDASVTWTGGSIDPGRFEMFGFEIEGADQPGALSYQAVLGYADGTSESATVVVTATAAATPGGAATADEEDGDGRANLALAAGGLALVLAGAALVLGRRSATPAGGAKTSAPQDW